jgi:hypothetical protein
VRSAETLLSDAVFQARISELTAAAHRSVASQPVEDKSDLEEGRTGEGCSTFSPSGGRRGISAHRMTASRA